MRDPKLQDALRMLAAEAATRFTSLVATGEELPFDVAENNGEHTFYRYVPLTGRFVREHADELRSLPAFGPACSAVDATGIAAPYLEARGEAVPEDEVERADGMLIAFIARLWDGATEFRIERPRLDAAIRELELEVRDISDADVLLVPLVGLQMSVARLELPGEVQIVRADTVEAPDEATRSQGMERSAWDPQFLAVAEKDDGVAGSAPALVTLRELVSVLRLFKEGGVGLGPFAYMPTGEESWKRIPTGVPKTRPGGYKLSEEELGELVDFARRLEVRPDPEGSLAWAVARFEMGCDRPTALDGLSDHLLAMRALFERLGPVGASLPMRAAALIAEPGDRAEAREKLQGAFELERAMMAGREFDLGSGMGLAAWVEDAARSVVRGAALGDHGGDVAASADESLVASGLEAGEGSVEQMGEVDEWEPPTDEIRIRAAGQPQAGEDMAQPAAEEAEGSYEDGIYYEPGEETETEPGLPADLPGSVQSGNHRDTPGSEAEEVSRIEEETTVRSSTERDWLSEVEEAEGGETMEWPAPRELSGGDSERSDREGDEEPLTEPRVRHLFPVPEDADWEVGELDYDRFSTRVS